MSEQPPVDIQAIFELGTPIDEALNAAVRDAVELHRALGLPMAVWQNGRVEWVIADALLTDPSAELPTVPPPSPPTA